jgi:hypothetical protein
MYSPKISEELIPRVYRAAKEARLPMTTWVNRVVERSLPVVVTEPKPTTPQKKEECQYEYSRN